jgi:hypothetical protein
MGWAMAFRVRSQLAKSSVAASRASMHMPPGRARRAAGCVTNSLARRCVGRVRARCFPGGSTPARNSDAAVGGRRGTRASRLAVGPDRGRLHRYTLAPSRNSCGVGREPRTRRALLHHCGDVVGAPGRTLRTPGSPRARRPRRRRRRRARFRARDLGRRRAAVAASRRGARIAARMRRGLRSARGLPDPASQKETAMTKLVALDPTQAQGYDSPR